MNEKDIKEKFEELEDDIGSLELNKIDDSDFDELKEQVGELVYEFDNNKSEINESFEKLDELNSMINELNESIHDIKDNSLVEIKNIIEQFKSEFESEIIEIGLKIDKLYKYVCK